jgi:hypothetical protein
MCKALIEDNATKCLNCGTVLAQPEPLVNNVPMENPIPQPEIAGPTIEEIYAAEPVDANPVHQAYNAQPQPQVAQPIYPQPMCQHTAYQQPVQQEPQQFQQPFNPQPMVQPQNNFSVPNEKEKPKYWLITLCVMCPLLGLIVWLVKGNDKDDANIYGKPALWGFIFKTVATIITIVVYAGIFGMLAEMVSQIS